MADGERWLSLKQVHRRLAEIGVDEQTIRAWGDKGRFGEVKRTMGGHRRYNPDAVDEALRKWRTDGALDAPTEPDAE